MTTISVTQFKARCLGIFETLHESSEDVVVTKHGKPVARVIPASDSSGPRSWRSLRGTAHFTLADILSADDVWEEQ
jgi:prevent-host-death family protein